MLLSVTQRSFLLLLIFGNVELSWSSSPWISGKPKENNGSEQRWERQALPIMFFAKGIDGLIGTNAASSVLRGARPVSSHSNWYREYRKTGGDLEAVEDFYRARPTHVTDYELPGGVYVKAGEIGDRKIIAKSSSDAGSEPTLEIIKKFKVGKMTQDKYSPGRELVDRITYTD